jgi:hypothetical protein
VLNLFRGLFRAWLLFLVLWVVALGALAWVYVPEMSQSSYSYALVFRQDADISKIGEKPLYDLILSPSKGGITPIFTKLGSRYSDEWDKGVKDGSLKLFQAADGAKLYLQSELSVQDTAYIEEAFIASKPLRDANIFWYWTALIVGPPIAILALGLALLWVVMGFAPSELIKIDPLVSD